MNTKLFESNVFPLNYPLKKVNSSALNLKRLKLAIIVPGRLHAFDLGRELIKQGIDLTLLTNYPKSVAEKFGIPRDRVLNCVLHGTALRIAVKAGLRGWGLFEPSLHRWFSRWAARSLAGITLDAVHSFSGVSEELFRAIKPLGPVKSLVRGSSHIRTQARLLAMEEARCGRRINRPSEWMIQRETLEYELADLVIVLSSFCRESFLQEGFADQKLKVLIPGNEVKRFRPTRQVIDERCERITRGDPLRVLMVGTFSYRKGVLDLAAIADRLGRRMTFRFVGDILPEARNLRARLKDRIEFLPRQPQFSLSEIYKWGDIFVFPTIEEGFPTVLSQAAASGLPILSTPNGAGTDLIQNDRTGWVLPIQSPQEFIDRLIWCDQHRREFATMVRDIYEGFRSRDWSDMAADLIEIYYQCMAKKAAK